MLIKTYLIKLGIISKDSLFMERDTAKKFCHTFVNKPVMLDFDSNKVVGAVKSVEIKWFPEKGEYLIANIQCDKKYGDYCAPAFLSKDGATNQYGALIIDEFEAHSISFTTLTAWNVPKNEIIEE